MNEGGNSQDNLITDRPLHCVLRLFDLLTKDVLITFKSSLFILLRF